MEGGGGLCRVWGSCGPSTARGGEAGAAPSCSPLPGPSCQHARHWGGARPAGWQASSTTSWPRQGKAGMSGALSPIYRSGTENESPLAGGVLSPELTHPPNPCLPLQCHGCPRFPFAETWRSPPPVSLLSQQGKGKDVGEDRLILVCAQHFAGHPVFLLGCSAQGPGGLVPNNVRSAPGRQPHPSRNHFPSWIPGISTSEVPTSWKDAVIPTPPPPHLQLRPGPMAQTDHHPSNFTHSQQEKMTRLERAGQFLSSQGVLRISCLLVKWLLSLCTDKSKLLTPNNLDSRTCLPRLGLSALTGCREDGQPCSARVGQPAEPRPRASPKALGSHLFICL